MSEARRAQAPLSDWARDRLGLDDFAYLAKKKEVPLHRYSVFYYLGGMALFLFLVQVTTGILLLLYYRPSASEAFESIQYIMAEVPFGWLIRSIHAWGANLFVGAVFLHLLSVYFLKAYRAPREMTWVSGVLLLFLTMGFGFSGYLLPWNTLSYFATKVGTDVPAQVPVIGDLLSRILRGGSDVTGATLSRFYGIHVAILPAITTLLLGLHVYLVQRHGMSTPLSVDRQKTRPMPFFPDFLLRDMVGWMVAIGLLAALSAFLPWELGVKADPFTPAPAGIRPEWYFLWMFQALKYFPAKIGPIPGETVGILLIGAIGALVILVPFLDRRASRGLPSPLVEPVCRPVPHRRRGPDRAGPPARAGSARVMKRAAALAFSLAALAARAGAAPAQPPAPNPCVGCHLALDDARVTPPAKLFSGDDVHARAGFTCVFCHGGDGSEEDMDKAHDRKKGWRGKPSPEEIPGLCAKCHSDAALMKQFNPSLRVDQLAEYKTSGHGKRLFAGDRTVAECASCHGAHGILHVKDSRSPVSTTQVARTCNRCHGDSKLMAAHKLPADVYAQYSQSVHFRARVKGDLSAPTCNNCHGNHGAAPPEVGNVANVCGTCHSVFAEQFKASPHWEPFKEAGLPGCVTCHGNHGIISPSEAFLSPGPQSRCESCHDPGSTEGKDIEAIRADLVGLDRETRTARSILKRAAEAGMEVSRQQFELVKADNALTKARADVHLFQRAAVHRSVAEGLAVAQAARLAGERSLKERDYRRTGLFVSLVFIVLAIAALLLKIRQLRGRNRPPAETH